MSKLTQQQKETRKKLYEDVRDNWPLRRGKNEFLKALSSENLITQKEMILGMCYVCCGGYEDGPQDCKSVVCPLYSKMPYRDEKERTAMPEEQKAQLIARLKAGREAKGIAVAEG